VVSRISCVKLCELLKDKYWLSITYHLSVHPSVNVLSESVSGKLITGAKILCPPSTESFQLDADELVPTTAEEESEEEDDEELEVVEMETEAEPDTETQPLKAAS